MAGFIKRINKKDAEKQSLEELEFQNAQIPDDVANEDSNTAALTVQTHDPEKEMDSKSKEGLSELMGDAPPKSVGKKIIDIEDLDEGDLQEIAINSIKSDPLKSSQSSMLKNAVHSEPAKAVHLPKDTSNGRSLPPNAMQQGSGASVGARVSGGGGLIDAVMSVGMTVAAMPVVATYMAAKYSLGKVKAHPLRAKVKDAYGQVQNKALSINEGFFATRRFAEIDKELAEASKLVSSFGEAGVPDNEEDLYKSSALDAEGRSFVDRLLNNKLNLANPKRIRSVEQYFEKQFERVKHDENEREALKRRMIDVYNTLGDTMSKLPGSQIFKSLIEAFKSIMAVIANLFNKFFNLNLATEANYVKEQSKEQSVDNKGIERNGLG